MKSEYWELRSRLSERMENILSILYQDESKGAEFKKSEEPALFYLRSLGLVKLEDRWRITVKGKEITKAMVMNRPDWYGASKEFKQEALA